MLPVWGAQAVQLWVTAGRGRGDVGRPPDHGGFRRTYERTCDVARLVAVSRVMGSQSHCEATAETGSQLNLREAGNFPLKPSADVSYREAAKQKVWEGAVKRLAK